jgi:hypothetical protein
VFVFATSDKGGTGRSVTSCNIVYRRALVGTDVCYLDFDFGSPTAGSIFDIEEIENGTADGGLHSYLLGAVDRPNSWNVWTKSSRESLRDQPDGAGRLVLYPGDASGGEFVTKDDVVARCVDLLLRLDEEFEIILIDLSAGRSFATEMVLKATADSRLRERPMRWLVYHRWTRQHIIAVANLVHGEHGLIRMAVEAKHDEARMRTAIGLVRTAVVDRNSRFVAGLRPQQIGWLREADAELHRLAGSLEVGIATTIGSVPLDPLLQWREQLISDTDTHRRLIANIETVQSFEEIAYRLTDDQAWSGL